jgi:hypothetical protein
MVLGLQRGLAHQLGGDMLLRVQVSQGCERALPHFSHIGYGLGLREV